MDYSKIDMNAGARALVESYMLEHQLRERYWAAGFFDGEGSIGVHNLTTPNRRHTVRYKYKEIRFSLTQVYQEPLDRFQKIFGVGKVYGPYHRPNRQPSFRWEASSKEDVEKLAKQLIPLLSSFKQKDWQQANTTAGVRNGLSQM